MCASWREYRGESGEGGASRRAEQVRKLGLLIVDDEGDIVDSLSELFCEYFEVHRAYGGEEALHLFREHGPKLIITDQRMPHVSGLELIRQIKGITSDVITVLVTGYSDIDVVIEALNEGLVSKYIVKPWEHAALRSLVLEAARKYLTVADHGEGRCRPVPVIGC